MNLTRVDSESWCWCSTARPSVFPGHRSGLVPIYTPPPPKLSPSRSCGLGAWRRFGSRLLRQLRFGLTCSSCRAYGASLLPLSLLPLPLLSLVSPLTHSRCCRCFCRWPRLLSASRCRCSYCYGRCVSSLSLTHLECPFAVAGTQSVLADRLAHLPAYAGQYILPWYLVPGSGHEEPSYPTGHIPGCVRHSPPNTCMPTLRRIYSWPEVWRRASFTPEDRCGYASAILDQESPDLTGVSLFGFICGLEFPSWSPLALQNHTWS